jgi:hypothetical protein
LAAVLGAGSVACGEPAHGGESDTTDDSGELSIAAQALELEYDAMTPTLGGDRYWVAVLVDLRNDAGTPTPLSFTSFSLTGQSGLAYAASVATEIEPSACTSDVMVLPDNAATCRVLFSIRDDDLPVRLRYESDVGVAETDLEICPTEAAPDLCGHACVDLRTSASHCGTCDVPVTAPKVCVDGESACPEDTRVCGDTCVSTSGSRMECDGVCVDLATDPDNCGACGNVVPDRQACGVGEPVCEDRTLTLCDGACIDLGADLDNCGGCGNACPVPEMLDGNAFCTDGPNSKPCVIEFINPGGRCNQICGQLGWTCSAWWTGCGCTEEVPAGQCACACDTYP